MDSRTPQNRILGSVAYSNLPRNVHIVFKDPETEGRRLFGQAKCNNAPDDLPSLAFRIEMKSIESDGEVIETAIPVFEDEPVVINIHKAMADGQRKSKPGPEPTKIMELTRWLVGYLRDHPGWVRSKDVFDAAGAAGLIGDLDKNERGYLVWSAGTMLYRAKDLVPNLDGDLAGLAVDVAKHPDHRGYQVTYWCLVGEEDREAVDWLAGYLYREPARAMDAIASSMPPSTGSMRAGSRQSWIAPAVSSVRGRMVMRCGRSGREGGAMGRRSKDPNPSRENCEHSAPQCVASKTQPVKTAGDPVKTPGSREDSGKPSLISVFTRCDVSQVFRPSSQDPKSTQHTMARILHRFHRFFPPRA